MDEFDKRIIEHIEAYYKETGRMITSREWDRRKYKPTRCTIKKNTGLTMNQIVKRLYDVDGNENNYDEEQIKVLVEIRVLQYMRETGRILKSRQWEENKYRPSRGTIRNKLGLTYNELLIELGFEPENLRSDINYTRDSIIENFKKFFIEENKIPTTIDMNKNRLDYMPCIATFYRHFGSLEEALIQAGLPLNSRGYSVEYLLHMLKEFIDHYDRIPDKDDLYGMERAQEFPEYKSFNRFGGVKKAVMLLDYSVEKKFSY